MQDIIADFIGDIGIAYKGLLGNFLSNFLTTIFLIILIRIIYTIVSGIFPGIKNLVYTVFKPFRLLHIWFHIQAAKEVNEKYNLENPNHGKKTNFSVLFSTGVGANSEHSFISFSTTDDFSTKDAIAIARAPLMPALVLLLGLILIGPLMTEGIFIFIHLYFLIGVTLVMFPSGHDNMFIFNTILTKSKLSGWYMIMPFIAFALTATVYTVKYDLLGIYPSFWWVEPFVMGLYSAWLYLVLLATVVWLNGRNEEKEKAKQTTEPGKTPSETLDSEKKLLEEDDIRLLKEQQDQLLIQKFMK